jgi:lipopolysaccharide transport system permease protein
MAKEMPVKTYVPDNSIKNGYGSILAEIAHEFLSNKWLIYQLIKRDISAMYKQSIMGVFWVVVIPLFSISTFVVLNRSGILAVGDLSAPYPLYAVLGVSFWQLFAAGLTAGTQSLAEAGQMIKIISFSKKALVISSLGRALVSFGIQMIFALILFGWFKTPPAWQMIFVPLLILPLLIFTFALALILSLLNGVMRDIGNALAMLMTFFMFLTPVLYARPQVGALSAVTTWNPMYYFVACPREIALTGSFPEMNGYWIASGAALALLIINLIIFHLTETRITERV